MNQRDRRLRREIVVLLIAITALNTDRACKVVAGKVTAACILENEHAAY